MSVNIDKRPMEIASKIRQLRGVLPYPMSWYESLSNERIKAVWSANVSKIYQAAVAYDEMLVRRKAGLC